MIYAITGGENPLDEEETARRAAEAAAAAEQIRLDEENRRAEEDARSNLMKRGRRAHEDILREKVGDFNVFKTPHQNIIAAHTLCETLEPLLAEHAAATPVVAKIKAMVTAAAIQQQQQDHAVPSVSKAASSKPPSDRERTGRDPDNSHHTRSSARPLRDAREYLNARRCSREEAAQKTQRSDDESTSNERRRPVHSRLRAVPCANPHRRDQESPGIDGIRAYTSRLRRADWPNGFSPKGCWKSGC